MHNALCWWQEVFIAQGMNKLQDTTLALHRRKIQKDRIPPGRNNNKQYQSAADFKIMYTLTRQRPFSPNRLGPSKPISKAHRQSRR
jgi:hypothetical protein